MSHNVTRRRFAQTAAARVGLPMILPTGLLAGQSPNEKLSFACIGMGGQMRGDLIPEQLTHVRMGAGLYRPPEVLFIV